MDDFGRTRFVTSKDQILQALRESHQHQRALGVWASAIGNAMMLCFVKEITEDVDEGDHFVMLVEIDTCDNRELNHILYVSEIDRIYSFNMTPNPTLKVSTV